MKRIILFAISVLCIHVAIAQKKKITVSGKMLTREAEYIGAGGKVVVLGGIEWRDTVGTFSVSKKGDYRFQVPDSLVCYQLIFIKEKYFYKHVQIYPELGDVTIDVTVSLFDKKINTTTEDIVWNGPNGYLQAAIHNAYYHVSDFEKNMVSTLTSMANDEEARKNFSGIDMLGELLSVQKKIDTTSDPRLRKIYLLEYTSLDATALKVRFRKKADSTGGQSSFKFFNGSGDPKILAMALKEISPSSGYWNIGKNSIRWLMRKLPVNDELLTFAENAIRQQATPTIAAAVLFGLAQRYKEENQLDESVKMLTRLAEDYPRTSPANEAKVEFVMFTNLAPGMQVPDFKLPSLDNPSDSITAKSLLGKTYLLEFWALWCRGCLQVIPELNTVYKRNQRKGFEIVSVYLDKNTELAREFRKTKQAMPWTNVFDAAAFTGSTARDFELSSIPKSVLVGPDGKIIAVNVRVDEIESLLKRSSSL